MFALPKLDSFLETEKFTTGIISIYGDFGVGKTTLALQAIVNAATLGKNIAYIWTKPIFPFEKIKSIIQENSSNNPKKVLDNIIFIRPMDFNDLHKIVFNLEFLIISRLKDKNSAIELIVIDSITDIYRLESFRDNKEKNFALNSQLSQIMATLSYINSLYSVKILVVNELSRKNKDGQTVEVQSADRVMDYWANYSLKISRTEKLNEREFALNTRSNHQEFNFKSQLTKEGFK